MYKKMMAAAMTLVIAATTASAGIIFSDDFEKDTAADVAPNTLSAGWIFDNTVSGNANSVTDKNEHRIFSISSGKGSKLGSKGWISSSANAFIYKDLGPAVANTNYTATAFIDCESTSGSVRYQMDLLVGSTHASAVSVAQNSGKEAGGRDGKKPAEFKRLEYVSGAVAGTDHIFLQIKRTGGIKFIYVDDVTVTIGGALAAPQGESRLEPARVFADHMVLQRGETVPVFGKDNPGQGITVEFAGQSKVTKADGKGNWRVDLDPMVASMTGRTLTITGSSVVSIADVLVGEVWVAAGQSNMEWKVNQSSTAPHPENFERIRMCNWDRTVGASGGMVYGPTQFANLTPENFYAGTWEVLNAGTVAPQSAVAYFFANALARELAGTGPKGSDVPVGIIELASGGTSTEAFIPPAVLQTDRSLKAAFEDPRGVLTLGGWTSGRISKNLTGYKHTDSDLPHPHPFAPGFLYYAGMTHIAPFACKGAIWYQGESNAEFTSKKYKLDGDSLSDYQTDVMTTLVDSWRTAFAKPELPFYMVQLPRINASNRVLWPWYREAQSRAAQARDGVEVAVVTEFGVNGSNVHPPNKEPVGERLAYIARNKQYGENIPYSGPVFASQEIKRNKIVLHFDHVEDGLISSDGAALRHFEIAGKNRAFVAATAEIVGDTVEVSAKSVRKPVAVRYGWDMNVDVNFYNKNSVENLPASPFRTEE